MQGKHWRQNAASMTTGILLSLLVAAPAFAAPANEESNPISGFQDWFDQQISSVREYASDILNSKLAALSDSLGPEFDGILSDVTGALGLPDPTKSRQAVEEAAARAEGMLYSGDKVANEIDRQSTRASANAILSQEGQEQQKKAYERTQQAVEAVGEASDAAQGEVVTQNVMKQIAKQNVESAKLMGGVQSSLLEANEQQAQTNTQLSNISQTVDGQAAQGNAERVGAGFSNLSVAAQSGLF
jgi:hypothetical protein